MKVQHKKTKKEHFIDVESWERLEQLGMQSSYKVIDNTEFVSKTVKMNPKDIEIFEIKLNEPKKTPKKTKKKDGSN